ncbi:unnamed protein product [Ostreobium quekettii]|uniref:Uncharacterized protein n=1 Tax=Ostreobium quekettii TaxID=121088 RepID=A0A8S1IN83_9CHLO|nr:unnamed protein product [Ostreobium quekettii]|eukprot:evm.model.scf_253EXC.8 EVM.evm.TU.scf_253EXC.8   scf_253EXC:58547-63032(+)
MTCGNGVWWCMALVLNCVAAAGEPLLSNEEISSEQHRNWLRGLNFDSSVAKTGIATKLQHLRRMLVADSALCGWKNGSCQPLIAMHAPDERVVAMSKSLETCENIMSKDACLEDQRCLWLNGCTTDLLRDVQDCLIPEYLTVRRAGLCPNIVREFDCVVLAGCEWDPLDGQCITDSKALLEALRSNENVSRAYSTNTMCVASSPCVEPCTNFPRAGCLFQSASDISQWFKPSAASPFCRSIQDTVRCQWKEEAGSCIGNCTAGEDGECTLSGAAIVDILYENKPDLHARMKKAVEYCPATKFREECEAFGG